MKTILTQIGLSLVLFTLNVATIAAFAATMPSEQLKRISAHAFSLVSFPGNDAATKRWDRAIPWGAATFMLIAASAMALFAFQAVPHVEDEAAYMMHARLFAHGVLWAPEPPKPVADALGFYLFQFDGARWFPVTMPGWPAALALGVLAGPFWLVNPILAAGAALLSHAFVQKTSGQGMANVFTALLAASPFLIGAASSLMPHALTLCLVSGAWLLLVRGGLISALGAGALMGWLFLVRPLEGVTVGVATGVFLLVLAFRNKHPWQAVFAYGIGCAAIGALIFPFNAAMTGDALKTAVNDYTNVLWGPHANKFGFGPDRGPPGTWGAVDPLPGFSPIEALANVQHNLRDLQLELFGWGAGAASLTLALAHSLWGRWSRMDWAASAIIAVTVTPLAFYWFSGGFYIGARYWFMTFLPLIWLSARGAVTLSDRLSVNLGSDSSARFAGSLALLCCASVVLFCSWRGVTHYFEFRGYHDDYRTVAHDPDMRGALVFVRARDESDFGAALFFDDPIRLNTDRPLFLLDRGEAANAAAARALPHTRIVFTQRAAPLDAGQDQ